MKLLRVGEPGKEIPAILDSKNEIRDLSKIIKDFNPDSLNFRVIDEIKKINLETLPIIKSNFRIGSCVSKPANFFAIGLNYKAHAEETNSDAPKEPIVFNKSPNCIVGPNDNVVIPKFSNSLDHEVEIAVVIGSKARHVKEEEAQKYILGYCICNDISEREWQKNRGGQWVKGKSGDTFGPLGPYLVTKDEIKDINNINLSLDVNGERRQSGNTARMIFNFDFLISHISQFMTLYPGTIITTGTPAGTAMEMTEPKFLQNGDKLILKVDFLGEQNQLIIE